MNDPSRRELLRKAGRALALTVLVGGTGLLVARDWDTCDQRSACEACRALRECGLPQAQAAREKDGGVDV